jgi:F0F1-type ATP synthase assembly protein I
MAIVIGGGVYGGIKLDEKYAVSPLFTLIFSLLSVGLAIYFVVKDLSK